MGERRARRATPAPRPNKRARRDARLAPVRRLTPRSFVCLLGNQRRVVTISGMVTVAEPVPLLLERDAELARLSALLEQAHAASGAVVTISGPAGIGKTQLLAALHRLARGPAGARGVVGGSPPPLCAGGGGGFGRAVRDPRGAKAVAADSGRSALGRRS